LGIARVSTRDQELQLQLDALEKAGCSQSSVFVDTASGELIFNIFSSLAQFERRPIQERTRAGLDAARSRGRKSGN